MKKTFIIATALAMVGCNTSQKAVKKTTEPTQQITAAVSPVSYAQTITPEALKEKLYTYASDDFQGRETGTEGAKIAVNYLKQQYTNMGIAAAKGGDNYFQEVKLYQAGLPKATLSYKGKTYENGDDFITLSATNNAQINTNEIVYAGYGIDDENYSDYTNLDVKGKVVLVKSGEPVNEDGTYVISGDNQVSKWSDLRKSMQDRIAAAQDKGAKALLFFDGENFQIFQRQYKYMKQRAGNGRLQLKKDNETTGFQLAFVSANLAKAIDTEINTNVTTKTFEGNFSLNVTSDQKDITAENVVAIIKGSEKPEEYVIVSAHLDHIGMHDGKVFNGADDDGSGTVSVLQIANAFKKAAKEGHGPKRSIVFLNVTGEEKGLLGSEWYSEHPVFPLANTVADLNIDMIGRIDPKRQGDSNYVYLIGSDKLSTDLHKLSEEVNKKYVNLTLDYTYNDENDPNRFYYRSDHYNFAKHGIPIIFYFNGTHADYHKDTDTPDKINYNLLAKRAQLVFYTAWEVANREKRIVVDKPIK
ncbi:M28 family peptidase [Zhouia sp. PK063]|uniref:M28 family peptidase n=1 Tax=Zhouia sp. PK063 TaxID=3373602 RepID=UPI0037936D9B